VIAVLCTWCDRAARWILVADADLQHHDHPACDEHRATWGHLYRRAVAVAPDLVVDVRDPEAATAVDADAGEEIDLRAADEPVGRHER
jgi:hypothetical protein